MRDLLAPLLEAVAKDERIERRAISMISTIINVMIIDSSIAMHGAPMLLKRYGVPCIEAAQFSSILQIPERELHNPARFSVSQKSI